MIPPKLTPGDSIHLTLPGGEHPAMTAHVASIHDVGLVLTHTSEIEGVELDQGHAVTLVVTRAGRALQAHGVVAGSSPAGIAVQLKDGWHGLERREFPRARACIPVRSRRLDDEAADRVAAAIRSRISTRPSSRPNEPSFDKSDGAALHFRLMKIERTLELLTDLVLWAGANQGTLIERHVELSASGLAFITDDHEQFPPGARVELEFLLPLRDPVRVRATAVVVRHVVEDDQVAVAVRYECIDEADRDEIARYVFQLQRRRQAQPETNTR